MHDPEEPRARGGMTRRLLGRMALLGGGGALLAACGGDAPAAAPKAEPTKAPAAAAAKAEPTKAPAAQPAPTTAVTAPSLPKGVTLEAWCHSDTRSAWQKKTIEDYNKAKGLDLKINWTLLANTTELADKLVVTIAGGAGYPDIADVEISQMGKLLKTATPPLVAYNDYLKGKEADLIKAATLDPWSLNGKWYGMGNELNVILYAYRTDIFEKVGITPPIKTWDDFVEAGKKLKAVASEGIVEVRAGPAGTTHMLAIQAGGGIFTADGKLQITHPANLKAVEYLADLILKHNAASLVHGDRPAGDPGSLLFREAMSTGKIASEIGPTWRISGGLRVDAPDSAGKWMVQHMPQWPGGAAGGRTTTSWGGTGMTTIAAGKNRELGVDFIVWEHTNPAVLHDFDLRQVWPTYKKVLEDPRLNAEVPWFNNQKVGQFIREGADAMKPFYQGVWWPEVNAALNPKLKEVYQGKMSPKQALDTAQEEARAAITKAGGKVD